ncbi:MAG: hypothetical protein U0572_02985 [Phycisphaerales bacterium]
MNALVAKDVRLSLDVLRPWALLVAGFGLCAYGITKLPRELVPLGLVDMRPDEIFGVLATVVGLTAVACSAWSTTAIVQGDRAHGAAHLDAALPVSARRRMWSKLGVVAVAAMMPALATVVLAALAVLNERGPKRPIDIEFILPAAMVVSALGAALALVVTHLVRGAFQTVAIAMLVGMAAAACGAGGAALGLRLAPGPTAAFVVSQSGFSARSIYADAMAWAAIAGACAGALVCGFAGALALARQRSTRWLVLSFVVAGVASFVSGAVAAGVFVRRDHPVLADDADAYAQFVAARMSDAELCDALRTIHVDSAMRPVVRGQWVTPQNARAWALLQQAHSRLALVDAAAFDDNALAQALRSWERFGTATEAWLTIYYVVPPRDPRRFTLALEVVARFPDSDVVAGILLNQPTIAERLRWPPRDPGSALSEGEWRQEVARKDGRRMLRDALASLVAEHHPDEERLKLAIQALDALGVNSGNDNEHDAATSPSAEARP